jgi:hypothetical protein
MITPRIRDRLKRLEAQIAPQSRIFVFFRAEEPGQDARLLRDWRRAKMTVQHVHVAEGGQAAFFALSASVAE